MKRTLLALALAVGALGSLPRAASAGETNFALALSPTSTHVCFALPAVQVPIHVMVSESQLNGTTQSPSEVMEAIVNQDAHSLQMTWIGTNSDGSQSGSNSLATQVIAKLWAPAPGILAELRVCNLPLHQIEIRQNPLAPAPPHKYFVTMFY
jgi:hypothetical protein